tara:strand:+ start:15394 stop:15594 length:201 start_codon:yes stop_codon:yes gene_type:complete
MTFTEFVENLKQLEISLTDEYLKKFGIPPPDLDKLAFLGSKVDILQESIDSNQPIQDIIIPEGADI